MGKWWYLSLKWWYVFGIDFVYNLFFLYAHDNFFFVTPILVEIDPTPLQQPGNIYASMCKLDQWWLLYAYLCRNPVYNYFQFQYGCCIIRWFCFRKILMYVWSFYRLTRAFWIREDIDFMYVNTKSAWCYFSFSIHPYA